jgi:hypothetical protein
VPEKNCTCWGEVESITGWVIGEYGAGGGEEASVVMVAALVVMGAAIVVAEMVVVMEVVVVVVIMSVVAVCGILLSAVALALLVGMAQAEFLLTMPTVVAGKNRRCSLPGLGPMYRPLSRPRYCWFRFLLL